MDFNLLMEADRRGILPPDRKALLDEARKRGLVPGEQQAQTQPAAPQESRGVMQTVDDIVRSVASGATFGFADELAAAASSLTGVGSRGDGTYQGNVAAERARDKEIPAHISIPGEIAGGVMTGTGLARSGLTLMNAARPTVGNMALRGATEGALYGAAHGAGSGDDAQSRLENALYGAFLGGGTGAATGAVAGRLAQTKVRAPTVDELKAQANAAYEAAERAGVIIDKGSFRNLAQQIQLDMANEGIDQTLHPRSMAALSRLMNQDENLTLKGADILRRVVRNAATSTDPSERRLATMMIERLDDYIDNLRPGDILGGNAQAAKTALNEARGLWSRARKGEIIENMVEAARDQASGFENGLRIQARQLLKNKKAIRGFSEAEVDALRQISRGGPVGNILRGLGTFGLDLGKSRNAVGTLLGVAAGGSAAGIPGAVVLPMVGTAARAGSQAITRRNTRLAGELMRQGGPLTTSQPLTPIQSRLVQMLLAGSASQAPRVSTAQ
jgi:hypothetical protein